MRMRIANRKSQIANCGRDSRFQLKSSSQRTFKISLADKRKSILLPLSVCVAFGGQIEFEPRKIRGDLRSPTSLSLRASEPLELARAPRASLKLAPRSLFGHRRGCASSHASSEKRPFARPSVRAFVSAAASNESGSRQQVQLKTLAGCNGKLGATLLMRPSGGLSGQSRRVRFVHCVLFVCVFVCVIAIVLMVSQEARPERTLRHTRLHFCRFEARFC